MPHVEESSSARRPVPRRFWIGCAVVLAVYIFTMLCRYGQLPLAPVVGDEIIINDASVSLAQGHGYAARSFADSKYGLDHVFAHFPPLYPYTEALAFHLFGISAYSLRLTTTVMSIATMVVFLLVLGRLCRARLLDWDAGILIAALFASNPSLLSFDRTARMESMVGLLVMLSLFFIFEAATIPTGRRHWPYVVAAACCASLGLAVHPEAVTALILIGALILFVIPGRMRLKIISVALFAIIPLVVGFAIFGPRLFAAVQQFLTIARDSESTEPSSAHQVMDLIGGRDVTHFNRALFLGTTILLFLAPLLSLRTLRRLAPTSITARLGKCLAVVGVVQVVLMIVLFRMSERRFEFLFGPMLLCDVLCLWGARPFRGWQRNLGWAIVAGQSLSVAIYLAAPGHSPQDRNPDRYLPLIHQIPAGAVVAATPGMWLDLQEAGRPFTLIYYGLDGEEAWNGSTKNPLDRFDVVFLEDFYAQGRPWWTEEAQAGRKKYLYPVGTDLIEVYIRDDIGWKPK